MGWYLISDEQVPGVNGRGFRLLPSLCAQIRGQYGSCNWSKRIPNFSDTVASDVRTFIDDVQSEASMIDYERCRDAELWASYVNLYSSVY